MKFVLFLSLPILLGTGIYRAVNGVFMAAFFHFYYSQLQYLLFSCA
jgi:hypothetical protein